MGRHKIVVDRDQLVLALNSAVSLREAAKKAGLGYQTFRRRCADLEIDVVPNQGGKGGTHTQSKPLETMKNHGSIKRRMIEAGIGNRCAKCGCPPLWNDEPLALHLDHIDGNRKNNSQNNLRLLCPNCHSQTPTWGFRNVKYQQALKK